jgi:hypothetical protein
MTAGHHCARTTGQVVVTAEIIAAMNLLQIEIFFDGASRDRTGDLRLANPPDNLTPPDTDQQNWHA